MKNRAIKSLIPALCCCLAIALGIGIWRSVSPSPDLPTPDNPVVPADVDSPIITGDGTDVKGYESSDAAMEFWWKNRLVMGGTLFRAIEENPDGRFSVLALYRPATAEVTDFVYEGKPLSAWAVEAESERWLPEKMAQLLKDGDRLKAGDAVYTVGVDGETWSKELYEERIAFYGEELLGKYIVDGEFLRDALKADLAALGTTATENYKRAYNAYLEVVIQQTVKTLTENGISCDRATYRNNGVTMLVTVSELENLPLDNPADWRFNLTSTVKGGEETSIADEETVKTSIADLQTVN